MKLSTKIITHNTMQMNKQLSCYFDHPFEIINPIKQSSNLISSLPYNNIISYILQTHQQTQYPYKCLILYKLQLDVTNLKKQIEKNQKMKAKIYEYDPKNKKLQLKLKFPGEIQYEIKSRDQNTLVLQIQSQQNVTRIYFLPHSNGTQQATELTRAIHQNFKFLRVLNQYLRLEDNCQEIQFSEPILCNLSEFLYVNEIKYVDIILWTQQNKFDMKLLQKIGSLKLPQPWLQKQSYRTKKFKIFQLKVEENKIMNIFKEQKKQFTKNINFLQQIAGNTIQTYQQINLQSLKFIKQQKLSQKLNQIKEHQKVLQNLQTKIKDLTNKKSQYLQKMSIIQKDQISQILALKKQILSLQQTQNINKNMMKSGLIFLKSRKSTQNRVLKTIFGNNDKKVLRMKNQLTQNPNLSISQEANKSSERKNTTIIQSKKQFKNNHKKVANVVKQIGSFKLSKAALRQKYQNEITKVDFEVEIRNNQLLNKFKNASEYLTKLLEEYDDLRI